MMFMCGHREVEPVPTWDGFDFCLFHKFIGKDDILATAKEKEIFDGAENTAMGIVII